MDSTQGNQDEISVMAGSDTQDTARLLFIGNLSRYCHSDDLFQAFESYEISQAKVQARGKKSMGYGFLLFPTHEAALKCKEECDGILINGRRVKISWAHRNTRLSLTKLDLRITREELHEMLKPYGVINEDITQLETDENSASAVVEFKQRTHAEAAKRDINGNRRFVGIRADWCANSLLESASDIISVHFRYESPKSDKLVDENLIYGYFSQYGTVADVSIKGAFVKPCGGQEGYGFVEYEDTAEGMANAARALSAVKGVVCKGVTISVEPSRNLLKALQKAGVELTAATAALSLNENEEPTQDSLKPDSCEQTRVMPQNAAGSTESARPSSGVARPPQDRNTIRGPKKGRPVNTEVHMQGSMKSPRVGARGLQQTQQGPTPPMSYRAPVQWTASPISWAASPTQSSSNHHNYAVNGMYGAIPVPFPMHGYSPGAYPQVSPIMHQHQGQQQQPQQQPMFFYGHAPPQDSTSGSPYGSPYMSNVMVLSPTASPVMGHAYPYQHSPVPSCSSTVSGGVVAYNPASSSCNPGAYPQVSPIMHQHQRQQQQPQQQPMFFYGHAPPQDSTSGSPYGSPYMSNVMVLSPTASPVMGHAYPYQQQQYSESPSSHSPTVPPQDMKIQQGVIPPTGSQKKRSVFNRLSTS